MRRAARQARRLRAQLGLVACGQDGDQQTWDAPVGRHAPLIWSICRRYRLSGADAEDAPQAVWLRLVDQLDKIRNPAAIAGWLRAGRDPRQCSCRIPRGFGYSKTTAAGCWLC